METVKKVFGVDKPIIGMLHLSGYGRDRILDNAKREEERVKKFVFNARNGSDATK